MPYNPDDLMIQCDECKDWYHPACVDLTIEQAKQLDHFLCSEHGSDEDVKKSHKTPLTNGKSPSARRSNPAIPEAVMQKRKNACMYATDLLSIVQGRELVLCLD
ncbi:UNVERIFIED_CONTAM: Chromatin remodeling protein EBS [Sesamum radiatum]|uniref:Chromatin remodeling protein EBS n=1 Tax=Sesamum radiatum TaxID=300843 RepID=A0AAW2K2P0_SESRA